MASTKDIAGLLKSHIAGDDEQLYSIVLQIAAGEARRGHKDVAAELRDIVSDARSTRNAPAPAIPFAKARGELSGLLTVKESSARLSDLVLSQTAKTQLEQVVLEQRNRSRLREHGKAPIQHLLLIGPSGTGKTMTAEALAGQLRLPLFVIRLEGLITRYLGETAAKLRLIFDEVGRRRAVYLFDEFDAVGSHRASQNDVAEMRRVLNSFLQFVEEPTATDSLIIAATNHPEMLDRALLRRFEDVVVYELPDEEAARRILIRNLAPLKFPRLGWDTVLKASNGLSQAELRRAAEDAVKQAILDNRQTARTRDVVQAIKKRKRAERALACIESL